MRELSLVMPFYENQGVLRRHIECWRREWSVDLRGRVEVVIVDDGSPRETAAEVLESIDRGGLPDIALYRVLEDWPWHQHGARNLGAHVATAPTLLMTDMDHVVAPSTLHAVLQRLPLRDCEVLTFGRVDAPEGKWQASDWPRFRRSRREDGSLKPHVNSFALTRSRYWKLGGYDESYCGIYGTDKEFRRRLFGPGTVEHHLDGAPLIRVDRSVIPDASTRGVERKIPGRQDAKRAVALAKAKRGESSIVKSLQFAWERIL